jgi:nucleotide-binding universal stress UspA family protein
MIRRVLVGLDGSKRAERSLAWASALAPEAELALADPTGLILARLQQAGIAY